MNQLKRKEKAWVVLLLFSRFEKLAYPVWFWRKRGTGRESILFLSAYS
jgi:hypothetical protein